MTTLQKDFTKAVQELQGKINQLQGELKKLQRQIKLETIQKQDVLNIIQNDIKNTNESIVMSQLVENIAQNDQMNNQIQSMINKKQEALNYNYGDNIYNQSELVGVNPTEVYKIINENHMQSSQTNGDLLMIDSEGYCQARFNGSVYFPYDYIQKYPGKTFSGVFVYNTEQDVLQLPDSQPNFQNIRLENCSGQIVLEPNAGQEITNIQLVNCKNVKIKGSNIKCYNCENCYIDMDNITLENVKDYILNKRRSLEGKKILTYFEESIPNVSNNFINVYGATIQTTGTEGNVFPEIIQLGVKNSVGMGWEQ